MAPIADHPETSLQEAEAQAKAALRGSSNMLEASHRPLLRWYIVGPLLHRGDSFVLVDCGGGTTDIGIYHVALIEPLRLGDEVHHAMGM